MPLDKVQSKKPQSRCELRAFASPNYAQNSNSELCSTALKIL